MSRALIINIGELYTGDLAAPTNKAKSLLIEDGRIAAFDPHNPGDCEVVIDACGTAVLPGIVK